MDQNRGPLVLLVALFIGILCVLFLMAFFAHAPVLCASFVGIFYVVGLYIATETQWRWHDAQEFENRFWTVTAFLFSTALCYAKDSPLSIARWSNTAGVLFVVLFTLAVQFYDRNLHRQEISRKPNIKTSTSHTVLAHNRNVFKYRATAAEKAAVLNSCVEQIDRMYLPSTINNMIHLTKVKCQERRIFRILAGASKDELNYIIHHIRLALLFYKVKDHYGGTGELYRTMILDLLCKKRLADLTVMSRAIVLDALMVMKISAHKKSEQWVRNIILCTYGDDLSRLKTYTDSKADVHSMHKLIFADIRTTQVRDDILAHIKQQAAIQAAHMSLGTKHSRTRQRKAWRKVLSDVDDTLYSSGGHYPAGVDALYPRHAIYPGVLSFYRELDLGTSGVDTWEDGRIGNLAFLSARPHVYKDVSEKKSYAKFQQLYSEKRMHTLPTLLAGCLRSGRAFMMQGDLEPMAQKKFENFTEYYQLYPEFTHIFVGDNGQADVRAAELISTTHGKRALQGGYFHLVLPIESTYGYDKDALIRWEGMNISFFNTYVGAAIKAYERNHIRLSSLYRISVRAADEFREVHGWLTSACRERARVQLNDDLNAAKKILYRMNFPCPEEIRLSEKPQHFMQNSIVMSPFGKGIVRQYRFHDTVYVVDLIDWHLNTTLGGVAYFRESDLSKYDGEAEIEHDQSGMFTYMRNRFGTGSIDSRTPFGGAVLQYFRKRDRVYCFKMQTLVVDQEALFYSRESRLQDSAITSPVRSGFIGDTISFFKESLIRSPRNGQAGRIREPPCLFHPGAHVLTPFGPAVVTKYRKGIYIVHVEKFDTLGYLHADVIQWFWLADAGKPVDTLYGTGILRDVRPDGIHVVQLRRLGASSVAFLQSSSILRRIKAAVGETVETPYGRGIVLHYRRQNDSYVIGLTTAPEYKPIALLYARSDIVTSLGGSDEDTSRCYIA